VYCANAIGKHISALEMAGGVSRTAQIPVKPYSKFSQRERSGYSHWKELQEA